VTEKNIYKDNMKHSVVQNAKSCDSYFLILLFFANFIKKLLQDYNKNKFTMHYKTLQQYHQGLTQKLRKIKILSDFNEKSFYFTHLADSISNLCMFLIVKFLQILFIYLQKTKFYPLKKRRFLNFSEKKKKKKI